MCHFFLFGEMRIHTRTRKIDNLCTTFFTLLIIFLSFLSNKVVVATSSFKNKNNTPHIINKLTFSNTYTYIPKSGIAFHHSSCAFENRTAHDKKEKLSGKTIKRLSSIQQKTHPYLAAHAVLISFFKKSYNTIPAGRGNKCIRRREKHAQF